MPDTSPLPAPTDRFVAVEDGFRVWTRSLGGEAPDAATPLLVLHGGPGVPHDYLENLETLASPRQRVVLKAPHASVTRRRHDGKQARGRAAARGADRRGG